MNDKSFANGNSPAVVSKEQRDSGWLAVIRPESHWTLTIGVLPA